MGSRIYKCFQAHTVGIHRKLIFFNDGIIIKRMSVVLHETHVAQLGEQMEHSVATRDHLPELPPFPPPNAGPHGPEFAVAECSFHK